MDDPLEPPSSPNSTTRGFTQSEIDTIVLFERLGAGFSIFGVVLIFIAFAAFKRLRTVPNTFIVFASFANLGASIACLMGYSGVIAGSTSKLCQAQAFMFELFMQSDPWWSLAMAVNVYLVFFFSANPNSFLRYWWAYFLVCYGVPFAPSLWLLLNRGDDGQNVYGDATIWCWIDQDSSNLRIYTYYLPIWVCIALSTVIYVAVGYYVFQQRNQLRNLSLSNPRRENHENLFTNAAVMGTVNREVVQVTTVNCSSTEQHPHHGPVPKSPTTATPWFDGPPDSPPSYFDGPAHSRTPSRMSTNPYQTTVTRITADPMPRQGRLSRMRTAWGRWRAKFANMDPVKLAYMRTSFIFAISVFVTWTPSSVNRVHDLIYRKSANFALNLASSIVLPLQGVWNAVIFFSTSWAAFTDELRALRDARRGVPRGMRTAAAVRRERETEPGRALELGERRGTIAPNGNSARKGVDEDDVASEISTSTTLGGCRGGGGGASGGASGASTTTDGHHASDRSSTGGSSTMRVLRGGSLTSL
ncbi:hypothetical protein F4778DRAFT_793549 [Xylariomycetidae sp. FL2044]|nr:hypothetical protein F4778DRAFT_793549 [Xylariomycetidae sp. FL2044]